jgi:hypothetical protein
VFATGAARQKDRSQHTNRQPNGDAPGWMIAHFAARELSAFARF